MDIPEALANTKLFNSEKLTRYLLLAPALLLLVIVFLSYPGVYLSLWLNNSDMGI